MNRVISKGNTEYYRWGNLCEGWHYLKNKNVSVIVEVMPVGTSEKLHYHENAQQFFYILKGMAKITIDGKNFLLKPSNGIEIEAMKRHKIANIGDEELEFLLYSSPPTIGDRIDL